jgi:hypothetical protein
MGKKTWEDDAWDPIRKGDVYCSRACGAGCTWKSYLTAKKRAEALVKRLNKSTDLEWKAHVWENMAWYYSARSKCGRFDVHAYNDLGGPWTYHAMLNEPNEIPGGKWVGRSDESPEAAIEDARRQAREYLERYAVCVDMELAPVLDPEVIERALCWFNGADKIDDEDCGLHRAVTLPEPIFQALTEHLKTMYHGDTGGTK